jgi:hypothetical protein
MKIYFSQERESLYVLCAPDFLKKKLQLEGLKNHRKSVYLDLRGRYKLKNQGTHPISIPSVNPGINLRKYAWVFKLENTN